MWNAIRDSAGPVSAIIQKSIAPPCGLAPTCKTSPTLCKGTMSLLASDWRFHAVFNVVPDHQVFESLSSEVSGKEWPSTCSISYYGLQNLNGHHRLWSKVNKDEWPSKCSNYGFQTLNGHCSLCSMVNGDEWPLCMFRAILWPWMVIAASAPKSVKMSDFQHVHWHIMTSKSWRVTSSSAPRSMAMSDIPHAPCPTIASKTWRVIAASAARSMRISDLSHVQCQTMASKPWMVTSASALWLMGIRDLCTCSKSFHHLETFNVHCSLGFKIGQDDWLSACSLAYYDLRRD